MARKSKLFLSSPPPYRADLKKIRPLALVVLEIVSAKGCLKGSQSVEKGRNSHNFLKNSQRDWHSVYILFLPWQESIKKVTGLSNFGNYEIGDLEGVENGRKGVEKGRNSYNFSFNVI